MFITNISLSITLHCATSVEWGQSNFRKHLTFIFVIKSMFIIPTFAYIESLSSIFCIIVSQIVHVSCFNLIQNYMYANSFECCGLFYFLRPTFITNCTQIKKPKIHAHKKAC